MRSTLNNESGFAMVVALSFVLGLGLLAVIVMAVSSSEKTTAFNEYTYTRSFYAADAGGEAAINWLRIQGSPPGLLDGNNHVHLPSGYANLNNYKDDHKYKFDITYLRKRLRPAGALSTRTSSTKSNPMVPAFWIPRAKSRSTPCGSSRRVTRHGSQHTSWHRNEPSRRHDGGRYAVAGASQRTSGL